MQNQLTMEKILSENSSTQLNGWVQEHVLGWIAWAEQRKDYISITFQKPGEREPYRIYKDWESMKERYTVIPYSQIDIYQHAVYGDGEFSTNIAATWQVEERFHEPRLRARYTNQLKKIMLSSKGECDTYDMIHASPADRCKAAIMTVLNL
ncbi:hypothetical protein ASD24_29555 [Paenibacillus sp. Root52]|uniref:hypothetical protein n=1 Tax=Paenibacillus sp. Root52 TaxID=1736552 RepID=UPI0006F2798A|nr:hypothetical protein [Paenibacillus sp. Root52]KQY83756.1 hypothetical protein ASD24_29555 [Paenibacillus sp. Root52]